MHSCREPVVQSVMSVNRESSLLTLLEKLTAAEAEKAALITEYLADCPEQMPGSCGLSIGFVFNLSRVLFLSGVIILSGKALWDIGKVR